VSRAPFVIAATAAGVAGVLSFKTRPAQTALPRTPVTATAAAAPTTAAAPATTAGTTAAAAPSTAVRTATGAVQPNQYGDVQVRVRVSGGRVTAVTAVALPQSDPRSQEISAMAGPQLDQQALAAQSAQIDGVSGATYTSDGYRASLQSALDQLGPLTG
jgi:uncharacterized protein with FMN-binding domain